jgi:hypothetical protein
LSPRKAVTDEQAADISAKVLAIAMEMIELNLAACRRTIIVGQNRFKKPPFKLKKGQFRTFLMPKFNGSGLFRQAAR